jgi:hypothetical protein
MAKTLAVLWLTIALGPKKSGSWAAASTASKTFHEDIESVDVVVAVVPLLSCEADAEVEEEWEGGNREGVGVAVPFPLLDEEEERSPAANISSNPPTSSSIDGGRGVTTLRRTLELAEVNDGGNTVVAAKAEAASDWV